MQGKAGDRIMLPDGRQIGYQRYGAAQGPVVIALHGTPGSRLKFSSLDKDARQLGLQVLAPDRWGYGLSDSPAKPSLRLFTEDLAAFSHALNVPHFAVIGVSGGGPYAAAAAALLPEQVQALGLISPVGPLRYTGARLGLTPFHRFCFHALPKMPMVTRNVFRLFRLGLRHMPRIAMHTAMARAAPADKAIMARRDVCQRLTTTFIEGLRCGVEGPVIDLALFDRDWNVPLEEIKAPAKLWIGCDDTNVPLSAAQALGADIADCDLTQIAGAGHLWVAMNYDVVLQWLHGVLITKSIKT